MGWSRDPGPPMAGKTPAIIILSLTDFKIYLEENVYDKIWTELSRTDRDVAYAIAKISSGSIKEIREELGMESNKFNPYRSRLIKKGIINGETYGYVSFTLPMFENFVIERY